MKVVLPDSIGSVTLVDHNVSWRKVSAVAGICTGAKDAEKATRVYNLFAKGEMSPFEFCNLEFILEIPQRTAVHFLRHRTSKNQQRSGRYTDGVGRAYVPPSLPVAGSLTLPEGPRDKVCFLKPQGERTQLRQQIDLRNFMCGVLPQRLSKHAQYETRATAIAMAALFRSVDQVLYGLWLDHIFYRVQVDLRDLQLRGAVRFDLQRRVLARKLEWRKNIAQAIQDAEVVP